MNVKELKIELNAPISRPDVKHYLVRREGTVVGLLEKWRNNRTDTHPWKAWLGWGVHAVYLGAFWGKNGKHEALAAIARSRREELLELDRLAGPGSELDLPEHLRPE